MNCKTGIGYLTGALLTGCLSVAQAAPSVPTHFPGCTPDRVDYFSYLADHATAVELCRVGTGWRFSNGKIGDKNVETLKVTKEDMVVVDWGNDSGIVFRHYSILTTRDGETTLHAFPLPEPGGTWKYNERLDDSWKGYVNKLYKKR